ncbi:5-formyltetrahydrofolate cyclo-ligase [Columba guinea]|nr:5-formyltetrahydrofolate cyclo-ligase [Columba guinea]
MAAVRAAKQALRAALQQRLRALGAAEKQRQSRLLTSKVIGHPKYQESKRIAIYLSTPDEIQTEEIMKDIFKQGKECFIPRYDPLGTHMDMLKISSAEDISSFTLTSWNILQPSDEDSTREEALAGGTQELLQLSLCLILLCFGGEDQKSPGSHFDGSQASGPLGIQEPTVNDYGHMGDSGHYEERDGSRYLPCPLTDKDAISHSGLWEEDVEMDQACRASQVASSGPTGLEGPGSMSAKRRGLDLIFMPGLGFDKKGNRLGRGKGYYDIYLERCMKHPSGKPYTIALAFKEQICESVPAAEHDIQIDEVLYEDS